ncbi:cell division protein FtsQ/DivIB [Candidatus Cardinium hertigii]|jgi:cell division protein FtsQ|nr:hypothetical protein [Candidatus Cardinium hertigii]
MGQIANGIISFLLAIGLGLSILLAEKKHAALLCEHIEIEIKDHSGQSVITEKDILDLLPSIHKTTLIGVPLQKIDTYSITTRLNHQPFVKNVLVYKTWHNTLKVYLETKYVIARMINPIGPHSMQMYIDENGDLIAIENLPLLRLLVIGGNPENIVVETDGLQRCAKELLKLLHCLYRDPFFRYQITSLEVENNHKIILGTQIGNHKIEFGYAENISEKLEKLRLFYSKVIPYKGWNAYGRVNLEFKDQLICE